MLTWSLIQNYRVDKKEKDRKSKIIDQLYVELLLDEKEKKKKKKKNNKKYERLLVLKKIYKL